MSDSVSVAAGPSGNIGMHSIENEDSSAPVSDDEYDIEESLVYVQLEGILHSNIFNKSTFQSFKVLGVNENEPIIQVENYIFSGSYGRTEGTAVFLEEKEGDSNNLEYLEKTSKTFVMRQSFLTKKNSDDKADQNADQSSDEMVET